MRWDAELRGAALRHVDAAGVELLRVLDAAPSRLCLLDAVHAAGVALLHAADVLAGTPASAPSSELLRRARVMYANGSDPFGFDLDSLDDTATAPDPAALLSRGGRDVVAQATEGIVWSYIHHANRIGALVEINCETDFAAKTDVFQRFAADVAMQIAAMSPCNVQALHKQDFVKDELKTIEDLRLEVVAKLGERIRIRRFTRYRVSEVTR
jgi:elongation factor Ts